jgi:hypothetical protein
MKVWKRSNGEEMEVAQMHSVHILNAIALLERQGYISARLHEHLLMKEGATSEQCKRMPSKRIDALIDELNRRDTTTIGDQ